MGQLDKLTQTAWNFVSNTNLSGFSFIFITVRNAVEIFQSVLSCGLIPLEKDKG